MIAAAADEVYPQTWFNYDLMEFLYSGDDEAPYRLQLNQARRKVLGEGAAALILENYETARSRGAPVLGELLGYGMAADPSSFTGQNLAPEALVHALEQAAGRSGIGAADVDLVVWAPQGNAQDATVLSALRIFLGDRGRTIPLATTTFNTGFVESASVLLSLAATLEALRNRSGLWPQLTGLPDLDNRHLESPPRTILVCAGSDVGLYYAAMVRIDPQ
jgi:3-oxoacyl-(acyl-carrier-protein) synthase